MSIAAAKVMKDAETERPDQQIAKQDLEDAFSSATEQISVRVAQEQILREAVSSVTPRCTQMIKMAFVELPRRRYRETMRELNLATQFNRFHTRASSGSAEAATFLQRVR